MEYIAKLLGIIMNYIFVGLERIGIHNVGIGIILFTVLIYMLLLPLTVKQQKFTKMQSRMAPELQKIQEKYKGQEQNPDAMKKLNEETKALYKGYGVSPAGGCLPMLLQMPILFALYRVIADIPAYVEAVRDIPVSSDWYSFFGMDISASPMALIKNGIADGAYLLVIAAVAIPVLSALSQWFSSWLMGKTSGQGKTQAEQPGGMGGMSKGMNVVMPLMSAFFCITLPVGMGIYWITGAVVRSVQQIAVNWWIDRKGRQYEMKNTEELQS